MKQLLILLSLFVVLFSLISCTKDDNKTIPILDTYNITVSVTDEENKIVTAKVYKNGKLLSDTEVGDGISWIHSMGATYSKISNTKIKITGFGTYLTSCTVSCMFNSVISNSVTVNKY